MKKVTTTIKVLAALLVGATIVTLTSAAQTTASRKKLNLCKQN